MARKKNAKKNIIDLLDKHPEGLTIQQIASKAKMSRITVTKYIHELLGGKKIHERRIGAYRLFSSKERYLKALEEEKIIEKLKKKLK